MRRRREEKEEEEETKCEEFLSTVKTHARYFATLNANSMPAQLILLLNSIYDILPNSKPLTILPPQKLSM